jgi:anthranilate/para-aminobenzoate synthase component I
MRTMLPSRRTFQALVSSGKRVPVALGLPLESDAGSLFESVDFKPPHLLLESARFHPVTGRYSFLVGEPSALLMARGGEVQLEQAGQVRCFQADPLEFLQQQLDANQALRPEGFPPFVGGAVGFISYDAYRSFEPNRTVSAEGLPPKDDLKLPDFGFLFCDQAIVLDHAEQTLWVIQLAKTGRPADRLYDEAVAGVEALAARVMQSPQSNGFTPNSELRTPNSTLRNPQFHSTHTRLEFEQMVRQAKNLIADGEIYQANLSQRFSMPLSSDPWSLYQRLKGVNPSPFAAYGDFSSGLFKTAPLQVISASPERLVQVRGSEVQTRPIAGTRPRGNNALETARLRRELILNEKERAEHLMLVDLERNDLGRVCAYGSVRVDDWMAVEEYSHVIHIVSNVTGKLRPKVARKEVLEALFPGGTITGCPKVRCLQIIEALEPVRRGLYTGSLGYLSYSGELDFNILIRTGVAVSGQVHVQTGAGIVADSDPSREYEETLHKAQALKQVFGEKQQRVPDLLSV